MFYSGTLLRAPGETASQTAQRALRDCSKEAREEPGYIGVFAGKKTVVEHQKITANHKNMHLKLMILALFYVWEDARIWAH